jgi:hypothetical protein
MECEFLIPLLFLNDAECSMNLIVIGVEYEFLSGNGGSLKKKIINYNFFNQDSFQVILYR